MVEQRGSRGLSHAGRIAHAIALVAILCGVTTAARADAVIKIVDRKFPQGTWCPLESRATAGADLSFVATATTMRVTFSANNFKGGNFNGLHLDDISVQLKSVFDVPTNQVVSEGYEQCYITTPPPGQATGGTPNAPAYDFNAASTPEVSLDQFGTSVGVWTGQHLAFDSTTTAPTTPAARSPSPQITLPDGSLALGAAGDGAVTVSASKTISGLTVGQTYVLFGWWKIQETDRLTISIYRPCSDTDGDGYVVCSGCDAGPGQTCGDCNTSNAHCNTNCTDADGDGWCVNTDCNDAVATCNSNCATDADADLIPDCRDGCIDPDRDGYGAPGGAGNTCLGADCSPGNPYCNANCADADGDLRCTGVDCNDADSSVGNNLAEINDWKDQQCPGDVGYGVFDETSGNSGFTNNANKNLYSWPAQSGANQYQAVRSSSRTFTSGCTTTTTGANTWSPAGNPPPGSAYYFLNRPMLPKKGSFGQKAPGGVERAVICGMETNCGNAVDDDADGSTDCADTDCANTAPCRVYTLAFTDTTSDEIGDTALLQFFQNASVSASDYIFFQIVENSRTIAWCSTNAAFYKTNYINLAPTFGSATSGAWNKWRKAPITGNTWQGPDTSGHANDFGDNCFGSYTWCSEQFPTEPKCSIFPDRTNDCEAYDLTTGGCMGFPPWQLTIKIAPTRLLACGF